ncbi:MAG: dihydroxy-acid dehydratase [bacterium]
MRSDVMKKGVERAPHRSLFKAMGYTDVELQKPIIGICNSWNELIPGHIHLNKIAEAVKEGIRIVGGCPMEFSTIGICDGIAMGHSGMKYSLPSRELIADSVEVMASAYPFDGLVCITNCDKIIPGMLMAMLRLNIPSIMISGGPMLAGYLDGKPIDLITVFEGVAKKENIEELENSACPGCGSCAGMFTANTMNCLTEGLGLALPGNGTIPAVSSKRIRLAKETGMKIMELIERDIKPRDIATNPAFLNAISLDMALGGSTNTVLHLPAIAKEGEISLDLKAFDEISRKTPNLCKISPASNQHIEDLDKAGGIPAVLKELCKNALIDESCLTVSGKTIGENIKEAKNLNPDVIREIDNPYSKEGGIAILYGNIAPKGCVVKQSAVLPEMLVHSGPARVFDSEEDAQKEILDGKIKKGDCLVIRYEGAKGGPGMREMLGPTSSLSGMGLDKYCALITDGRFSGGSKGAAIGHILPEAQDGGPIAIVKEGDIIKIDIPNRRLDVEISDNEIKNRLKEWKKPDYKIKEGYLYRYITSNL